MMIARANPNGLDRWNEQQLFEEDLRAVMTMLRPHKRERLLGWSEYRTGGANFRATIAWDPEQEVNASQDQNDAEAQLQVPRMTDVLEAILVGSVKNQDDIAPAEEFEVYRDVLRELGRRLDEMQRCYE